MKTLTSAGHSPFRGPVSITSQPLSRSGLFLPFRAGTRLPDAEHALLGVGVHDVKGQQTLDRRRDFVLARSPALELPDAYPESFSGLL
jgi:hypothetical protein